MEASENAGVPRLGGGARDIRRIDPTRVRETLSAPASERGYARLLVMLGAVFPRLTDDAPSAGRD
jgi:hypothetical protein